MRSLVVLGSTGSIGTQALDVVRRSPDRFRIVGLAAAGTNLDLLTGQVREFLPSVVAVADPAAAEGLRERLAGIREPEFLVGRDAAELARSA